MSKRKADEGTAGAPSGKRARTEEVGRTRVLKVSQGEYDGLQTGSTVEFEAVAICGWAEGDNVVVAVAVADGGDEPSATDTKTTDRPAYHARVERLHRPSTQERAADQKVGVKLAKTASSDCVDTSRALILRYVDTTTNKGIEHVTEMEQLLPDDWRDALSEEFGQPYWRGISEYLLEKDRMGRFIYPEVQHIFRAFHACPVKQLRACIVGQDPYHGPGQAHGLCFSVPYGVAVPSSLQNIYTELMDDIGGFPRPTHGSLIEWAEQGVLLLNTALTVTHHQPASHSGCGWHKFTEAVVKYINENLQDVVFFAWGQHAQSRTVNIVDPVKHLVLVAAHPSGRSADRGFLGCRHFSQANSYLASKQRPTIRWTLTNPPPPPPPPKPAPPSATTASTTAVSA